VTRTTPASFYFDLASPLAYLAAERILHVLPGPAEWRPVLAGKLAANVSPETHAPVTAPGVASDSDEPNISRSAIERRAHELGLQPIRWPEPFPFDSSLAMRVATYAASIGRAVPFAQAAFRQAFAGGHSLEDPDFVLIAAAACEMHPTAVLRGAELRSTAERLEATTLTAAQAGVTDVPAIIAGEHVYAGEDMLERAAQQLRDEAANAPAQPAVGGTGAADPAVGTAEAAFELHVQRSGAPSR
jgi:2-hydroxychromene-2-carboxylate isomerase